MAVLKNLLLGASLLTPFVLAAPAIDKRSIYTHTQIETTWITFLETATVWVNAAEATPAPPPSTITTTAVTTSVTTSVPAAVFAQSTHLPSTFATEVATTSSVPVAVAAAPSVPAASSPSPAVLTTPVVVQPKDVAGSTSGTCEGTANACVGDVTHWDGGLGACGWTVNSASEMVIALPHEFMGTQSNGNPYCGRAVTLVNPASGTTVQATVGDKCMGCIDRSIDCTDALFNAITDGTGDGREGGIQWYFS